MVHIPTYRVFGREIGAHVLSMATLGSTAAIAFFSLPSKPKDNGPPINAKSKEEESFVKDFVKKATGEKK